MKHLRKILLITLVTAMLPIIAHANAGPAILWQCGTHLVVFTWVIGIGEGLLLCMFLRAWRFRFWKYRIFISMIAANIASAWLGMLFVKSRYTSQIMGDVTVENLIPAFWTMVYVTFVLTMIIEFPFFLVALYGRKWLVPKGVAATIFVHCISYSLLFFFYRGEDSINMVAELELVPASTFEMKEDYDLYYISPDGKHVLRSDLAGNDKEVIATLDMDGIPDRLCACPRKVTEEIQEGTDNKEHKSVSRVCWESGFDLCVLMNYSGKYKKLLLSENFSSSAAVDLWNGEYRVRNSEETEMDFGDFRSFGNAKNWEFNSDYWTPFSIRKIKQGYQPYTTYSRYKLDSIVYYRIHTPFVQWSVRNGSHIAGDYAVFLLGKDQICILDPEKKRIALITRGFGPVVAKPPLEEIPKKSPEETNEQTANEVP